MDKGSHDLIKEKIDMAQHALTDSVVAGVVAPSPEHRAVTAIYDLMDAMTILLNHTHHDGMR